MVKVKMLCFDGGMGGGVPSPVHYNDAISSIMSRENCTMEKAQSILSDELFSHSTTINLYGETDDKHMALYESFARENESEYGKITINRIRR